MDTRAITPAHPLKPVVIVGGGLSGLAAGVFLSRSSLPVRLLEQRPFLGGRAYSFTDAVTGAEVDNGQHLLVAGYRATFELLEILGTAPLVNVQKHPSMRFHHPARGFRRLALPPLPSPAHLGAGVLATSLFSCPDRLRVLRGAAALLRSPEDVPATWTVADWLRVTGQSEETRRSFWEPLAVAIMNERVEVASGRVLVRALRRAFLDERRGAALATPTIGLSRLYADAAAGLIMRMGGMVECSTRVQELVVNRDRVVAVRRKGGPDIPCEVLVLAVPHVAAAELLPAEVRRHPEFSGIAEMKDSPIISIHLWFPKAFMGHDTVGVIGRRIHWVFQKQQHVSVTISAAHDLVSLSNIELVRIAVDDLRSLYGGSVAEPHRTLVIREKRATFSCTPESELLRPASRTPLQNLFLAGDWTGTGLPATIEGAVVSGKRASELVMESVVKNR